MSRRLRLSLFVLAAALPASCGGSVGSDPDVDQAGMPGRDQPHAGDSGVAGGTTGTGGMTAEAGSGPGGGRGGYGTGGGGEDGNAFSGNMAGGAGPPVYACEARDVARKATSAVTLPPDNRQVNAQRMLADAQGNTYVAGSLAGSSRPDFGGGALLNAGHLFLVKLNPSGQHLWSLRFGSLESDQRDELSSLFLTPEGDILLGANLAWGTDSDEHRFAALRFDASGQLLQNVVLDVPPKASLSNVWSVDAQLFFAFALGAELSVGDMTFQGPEQANSTWPVYVLRFDPEHELPESVGWIPDGLLSDVAADAEGNSYFLTTNQALNPGSSRVLSLSRDLETRWQLDMPARLATRLALGNAQLVAGGVLQAGPPDWQSQIFLQPVNPNSGVGMASHVVPLNAYASADILQALAVLPDDSVVLGAQGSTGWTIGGTPLKSASGEGTALMQISAAGEPLWATLFCFRSGYGATGTVAALAHNDGTLRALVKHEDQLEVGLSQPLGSPYDSTTELLTLDLDETPEGEP